VLGRLSGVFTADRTGLGETGARGLVGRFRKSRNATNEQLKVWHNTLHYYVLYDFPDLSSVLNNRIRPAIHGYNGTGHVARPARCKEDRDTGYFFWLGIAAERDALDALGEQLRLCDPATA
jgi:hypothetical protein